MKKNSKITFILISILMLLLTVFFCSCGIDTSTVAGSASQIHQQKDSDDEVSDEDTDIEDADDTSESDGSDSEDVDEDSEDEEGTALTYVLNTNTKKFHYPDCKSVKQMKDKNKLEEKATREDLIERGYSPCGNCNP